VSVPDDPTPRAPLPATTLLCDALEGAASGETVSLGPEEVAHARALRLAVGQPLLVTDGRGRRWEGELVAAGRRSMTCRLLRSSPAPAPRPLSLWAPVGHRDRALWLVEKAVELGVRRIAFAECARSRSVADAGRSAGFMERARRRAIGALTQSGGADLPALVGPVALVALLDAGLADPAGETAARWLADPEGPPLLEAVRGAPGAAAIWLVGPEGGLTADERHAVDAAGFEPVSLGARTLRFETAAVAGLAILAAAHDASAPSDPRGRPGRGRGASESAPSARGGRSASWSGAT